MEDYNYLSLSGEGQGRQIRLVKIHPGTNGPLECTLNHVSLERPPVYEALSYTWGNEEPREPIVCNGLRLQITPNLHAALLQLRNSTSSRTVWADAICIDQTNDTEKSIQVLLMPTIYRQADRVLIWLGKERDDSPVAMAFIRDLFEHVDLTHPVTSRNSLQEILRKQKHSWNAVSNLLGRAWFQRVWVIQEAALSSSARVLCGNDELPWEAMVTVALYSFKNLAYQILNITGLQGITVIYGAQLGLKDPGGLPLLDILASSRGFLATNPKDKIYAVLGLCHEAEQHDLSIVPDYKSTTTPYSIYESFARVYLKRHKPGRDDLDLLFHATETKAVVDREIPSWVPDWSVTIYTQPLIDRSSNEYPQYQATEYSIPTVEFGRDNGLLGLSGHVCGHIAVLGSAMENLMDTTLSEAQRGSMIRRQYATLLEWERLVGARSEKLYPTGETMSRAFHHTLVGGYVASAEEEGQLATAELDYMAWSMHLVRVLHHLHLDVFPSVLTLAKDLVQVLKPNIWGSTKSQEKYYNMCLNLGRAVSHRRIVVSTEGYIGLVPAESRSGDAIALVKGSKLPFVLRKCEETDAWMLVGCCFVHGMMHGQRFNEDECKSIWLQ